MTTIAATPNSDLSGVPMETLLHDTMQKLDSWVPGAGVMETYADLQAEYTKWQASEGYRSLGGLVVEYVFPSSSTLRIPDGLGYKPNRPTVELHFLPTDNSPQSPNTTSRTAPRVLSSVPRESQKYMAIRGGLEGALHYITLVESGLLPKPEYMIGDTNKTMARFARRAGFKSASSIAEEKAGQDSKGQAVLTEDDEWEIDREIDRFENFPLADSEASKAVTYLIEVAARAKRDGRKPLFRDAIRVANGVIRTEGSFASEYEVVWARYEDFCKAVLDFKQKFGNRILKLVDRDMIAMGLPPMYGEGNPPDWSSP